MRAQPMQPAYAILALEDADDREQIFDVLLRAVRSHTKFAALLSVSSSEIRGRRALADEGIDRSKVDAWRIPRELVPAFEKAIASRAASVGAIACGEPFVDGLLEQLGGASPAALVLPIAIGARTVALVVAHRGGAPFALVDVADLLPLADAASPALARVLASRAKPTAKPAHDPGYEVEVVVPDVAKRRARIAELRAANDYDKLADALREHVAAGMESGDPDEDEQLELLVELGRIEADKLGRVDRAIDAWRSAQTIDAGDARVLDALHASFQAQGRWVDLAELLEKRAALADDPAARIALYVELAALAHERLDDDERAIAAYERILNWEPAHDVATRELEHLYSGREQWQPLAALLLDRASRVEDSNQAVSALEAVAQMYEDKVGDLRAAFLVWLAVIRREPERANLVDQLERIGPAAQAWDEVTAEGRALAEELEASHAAVAARVWRLVASWSRAHGTIDDAAHALERAAVLETEPGARAEILAELGSLYEHDLGAPAEAIARYQQALADEPEALGVIRGLHGLYRQLGRWTDLAQLLPHLAKLVEMPEKLELYCELGDVLSDHLEQHDDAVRAYSTALELEPRNPAAFHGLARLYRESGQVEKLLDTSEGGVDAADHAVQVRTYPKLAAAWREHGRFDRATACWQKLVAIAPDDVDAHRGLAASLRDGEQREPLVAALRALLELVDDPAEQLAIELELGGVLAQLDDAEGALAAYEAAVALDGDHRGALDALARLHERAGRTSAALPLLDRLVAQTTSDLAMRAQLLARIGSAYLDARDVANARLHFMQAIGADPDHASAHEGLARVYLAQDEIVAGGEELVRAAELSTALPDKLRCLVDAAWVFRHRLRDSERARQCLQLVLELEPEHGDAKLALAELLQDTKQWDTLWPHLEQEVQRARADVAMAPHDRADIYARAARCALELDRFGVALELYELACGSDPSPAMQIERAEALYRAKSLDAAAAAYQSIALRFASSLEPAQQVAAFRRLAEIHTQLGKAPQAQLFHQKVLELDPKHKPTLRDLAELHASRGRHDEAIASLRALADAATPAERVALLERIGDLYRDHARNAPRAMSTYLEALELEPGNRRALQRVLELQTSAGQWKAAVDTIARFLDVETDPQRRAAYHLAAAEIRRNELKDRAGALGDYEHALDELMKDPAAGRARALETFRAVDELLTADKSWKAQEQAYRRMIKRLPVGDPALVALWDALGEIYRTRLKLYQSAIEAFELAHSLDATKSPQRAAIMAQLYELSHGESQIVRSAAQLVALDPDSPHAYRALGRASLAKGRVDEAWCAARALVFLKLATAEETALYTKFRANETRKATTAFDERSWAHVRHADEDRTISAIFALVWEGPVALRAGSAKQFELKPKERLPVEDGTRVIAKIFRHAARVLGVALPDVYVQPHRAGRLMLANCIDRGRLLPAVIVGRDLMTGYRDTELAAAVGALLAVLRPAYYLKLALPSVDELEAALAAAAALGGRANVGRAQLAPLRDQFAAEMQRRFAGDPHALRELVARLPAQPDVARWRNAVDATAQRAGLLVCGELAAAARMLATEAGARARARVEELVAYSVSPAYFAARQHLGVAVA